MACPRPSKNATRRDWNATSISLACAAACAPSSTTIWYARPARMAASPFGALLYGLGDQLGGAAVDTMVTPTGIGAMLQGHVLWKRGRNELQGGDAFGATEPARPLKNAEHHFEALDRFVIDVDRGPDQPPMKVVLEPQGLRWKVVDLQLGMSATP
jgi:hypothetical protein